MIIDAHSHVHDPVDAHLALLDEAGVDRAVLFATRAHPERAKDLAGLNAEFAVLADALGGGKNGGFAAAIAELHAVLGAHPDRFIGFGSVPLGDPDIAGYVDREIAGRGLRGIGELTPPPDRAELVEPVLRAAADHGLPVVVHGFAPTTAGDVRTLAALARRHPRVPLVLSQLGGLQWTDVVALARETPNLYVELSTPVTVFAVRLAIAELPERTLFGSDAPYGDPVLARLTVERATRSPEVRARVLGGTLLELLTNR